MKVYFDLSVVCIRR